MLPCAEIKNKGARKGLGKGDDFSSIYVSFGVPGGVHICLEAVG